MFTGLSAFPLTPFKNEQIDFASYEKIVANLVKAKVNSICAMGSTGLYPYLSRDELFSVAKQTVEWAQDIPVMAGIGSLRTLDVLKNAEAAQEAGVSAVLLAPVSYHPLEEDEVFALYEAVTAELSVPLCVYENSRCTNFTFSDDLFSKVSSLPMVGAIKVLGTPFVNEKRTERLAQLRNLVSDKVAIGVSGDQFGAAGMAAGCDLWLSVLGGLFPNTVQNLIHLAQSGPIDEALQSSQQLDPLWELFVRCKGGMRVMATAADILGYSEADCLPAPLKPLSSENRAYLIKLLKNLDLD